MVRDKDGVEQCKHDLFNLWKLSNEMLMSPHCHPQRGFATCTTQLIPVADISMLLPQALFQRGI